MNHLYLWYNNLLLEDQINIKNNLSETLFKNYCIQVF